MSYGVRSITGKWCCRRRGPERIAAATPISPRVNGLLWVNLLILNLEKSNIVTTYLDLPRESFMTRITPIRRNSRRVRYISEPGEVNVRSAPSTEPS
jgi:hypothetical protein